MLDRNGRRDDLDRPIDPNQILQYAQEIHRLHDAERASRRELEDAKAAVERAQAQQLALIADLKQIYEAERRARNELREAYIATVKVLAAAVEAKDDYTGGHVERVRSYSAAIARQMGMAEDFQRGLSMGSILHDVGKVGVPDRVLGKPGPLSPEEWVEMKQHPLIGSRLLSDVAFLAPALEVVANHHERWDGGGYPLGLRGEAIPLAGRIVAVADAFDALTTDRVYRGRRGTGAAVEEIERCTGTQFDPDVVDAFLRAFRANALVGV